MIFGHSSNNSGGTWWLSDQDWCDMENEGWTVNETYA